MIVVNATGFSDQEIANLNQAADLWDIQLASPIQIDITIEKVDLGGALLGLTIPNGVFAPNHGTQNCWYVSALADKIANVDNQPGEPDAAIYIDSGRRWYCGAANEIPQDEFDFFSNALHEMGHAFGYVGLFSTINNDGLYGHLTTAILPPAVHLPFQFPALGGWPSILGLQTLSQQRNQALVTVNVQCPDSGFTQLGQDLVSAADFRADGGTRKVYAPAGFQLFSSFDHIDPLAYPQALMQPSLDAGVTRRVIDADSWSVLPNLGW
jgi:hypothetical protein